MILANNKKAKFNYEILSEYQAGIKLIGSEVKPSKKGKVSIAEAYCIFKGDELYITNMNIHNTETNIGVFAHDPTRERKLLLHRKELTKIKETTTQKGLTIIPLKLITTEEGLIKLLIGVGRGKNTVDKKSSIKERDIARDTKNESETYKKGKL